MFATYDNDSDGASLKSDIWGDVGSRYHGGCGAVSERLQW